LSNVHGWTAAPAHISEKAGHENQSRVRGGIRQADPNGADAERAPRRAADLVVPDKPGERAGNLGSRLRGWIRQLVQPNRGPGWAHLPVGTRGCQRLRASRKEPRSERVSTRSRNCRMTL